MGTCIRIVIDELSMQYKLNIQPCAETNDSNTLMQMVRTGKWISIGTDISIGQYPDLSGITIEEPTPRFTVAILLRKAGYHNRATKNSIKMVVESLNMG